MIEILIAILIAIRDMPWLWSGALVLSLLGLLFSLSRLGDKRISRDLPDHKTKWGPE